MLQILLQVNSAKYRVRFVAVRSACVTTWIEPILERNRQRPKPFSPLPHHHHLR